jgi:hypothetical protein
MTTGFYLVLAVVVVTVTVVTVTVVRDGGHWGGGGPVVIPKKVCGAEPFSDAEVGRIGV